MRRDEACIIIIGDYGYTGDPAAIEARKGLLAARVTEVQRERYTVVCEAGERKARLTGSFLRNTGDREDYPAVGDFVLLRLVPDGDSSIKSEPGCAVLAALEDGSLSRARWEAYLAQRREAALVRRKSAGQRCKKTARREGNDRD